MFESLKNKLSEFFSKKKEEVVEDSDTTKEIIKEEKSIKTDKSKEEKIKKEGSKEEKITQKKEEKIKKDDVKDKEERTEEKRKIKEEVKEDNKEKIEYIAEKTEEAIKKKGLFKRIKERFTTTTLEKKEFEELFEELEMLMIENNVALSVIDKIREDLEKEIVGVEINKNELDKKIKDSLKKSISSILIEPFNFIEKINNSEAKPFVILFFGINGSGKTTTISKIADMLNKNKISSVISASDTFRAASIEQLKKHGEKLGVKIIHQNYGADPSAVAFDTIQHAKSNEIKVVLIDTAGRMHTKDNLLKEMDKIIRVTQPNLKIFVAESITGNDATEQAKIFNESFGIDGTILTKADVDEKGGTAISIGHVTKKPILFLGTGQEYKNLEKFSPEKIIESLGLE
jgi:fused signal recognition particle receptor